MNLWHRITPSRFPGFYHLPRHIMADKVGKGGGDFKQCIQINTGIDAHGFKHMHQVFGAYITASAGGEGAATEPT